MYKKTVFTRHPTGQNCKIVVQKIALFFLPHELQYSGTNKVAKFDKFLILNEFHTSINKWFLRTSVSSLMHAIDCFLKVGHCRETL